MIKVIIPYDDNDSELGGYFEDSFNDINTNIYHTENITVTSIRGLECLEEKIISVATESKDTFIFIGISHGNEKQLLTENYVFVDSENVSHFNKSFFYTPACSTALVLGKKLIENGCSAFIGCNKDTFVTFEDFNYVYIECENYCIKEFLNSNDTIQVVFDNMLAFFDNKIDLLFEKHYDEVLLAMELQHNKDSFVLYGNKDLKKSDFEIEL